MCGGERRGEREEGNSFWERGQEERGEERQLDTVESDRNELPGRRGDFRSGKIEVEGEFPLPPPLPSSLSVIGAEQGMGRGRGL